MDKYGNVKFRMRGGMDVGYISDNSLAAGNRGQTKSVGGADVGNIFGTRPNDKNKQNKKNKVAKYVDNQIKEKTRNQKAELIRQQNSKAFAGKTTKDLDLRSTYEKESAKAMGIKEESKLKWTTMNEKLRTYPNFNYLPVNDQSMMTEVMMHLCEDANSDYTFVDELI